MAHSWVSVLSDSDFSVHNLPFGIFSTESSAPRVGVAIGSQIVDMAAANDLGIFGDLVGDGAVFLEPVLNPFIDLGKPVTKAVRERLQESLCNADSPLRGTSALVQQADAQMHLPIQIGDYTDFYSSIEHATNVGKMFRDPENALLPNWKHIPVGYHGRSSSIIPSGVPVRRPWGQVKPANSDVPVYQPSGRLDFELEMGFVIGKPNALGSSVSTQNAEDHIFGLALFNDWSARDIQKWEYVPLGPFLGKSFASSLSPWIVTLEALEPFRVPGPAQDPEVLPYLAIDGQRNYDIRLEVGIKPAGEEETIVSISNFRFMYWSMTQQLAHHTVNGCNVRTGDLLASGTISGKVDTAFGSMLELSWGGKKPVRLKDGTTRTFINDADTVIMRGHAEKDGVRVGFGEVRTEILPAEKR